MKIDNKINKSMLDYLNNSMALINHFKKMISKAKQNKKGEVWMKVDSKLVLLLNSSTIAANEIEDVQKQLEKSIDFFEFN